MNQYLGTVDVIVTARQTPGKFSHELVTTGLRAALMAAGIEIGCAETTQNGPGSELAVRVNLGGCPSGPIALPLSVRLVDFSEPRKTWNSLVVLDGFRGAMKRLGAPILATEKTAGGRGGEIATRVVAR